MAQEKLTQTMRIDLIPDTPSAPVDGERKKVLITSPTRRRKKVIVPGYEKSASKYQQLLQSVYDSALITNLNGAITDANVRAVEKLIYEEEELRSMNICDIISGADTELLTTLCDNLDDRFTVIQAACIRKDGSTFPAEIAVNKLSFDDVKLCFFMRDITLRLQREEMLRTTYNAIQNAGDGIAVANLEAVLEYVNPALAKMWGHENPQVLMGTDVRELMTDIEAANNMIGHVMGPEHDSWMQDMIGVRRDGSEFDVQVSVACNRNADGEVVGTIFSFVDISDRKRAEEALREAEHRRVMLESLGAACHHLGQPATVLMGNLGIIRKRVDSTDDEIMKDLIKSSITAMESMSRILYKLNTVNVYKTTQYLEKQDTPGSEESRILEI